LAVDVAISKQHLREELALVKDVAATNRWGIVPDYDRLTVVVTMHAHTGELFIVEARCDDYKQVPPYFEFIDPDTGERGTRHAYPTSTDSFFHGSGPCICARFSRKAYKTIIETGPHADWQFGDWQTASDAYMQWANCSKLGDMLGAIHTRLVRPDLYKGRMA
jgi:hypothetical protein